MIGPTLYTKIVVRNRLLGDNTSRGLAEDVLAQDREDAAASALSDGRANGSEVGSISRNSRGVCAVKVGNTQNVRSTALRGAVESGAGGIGNLTVLNLNRGGEGHTGEDGSEGKSELHGEGF